MIKFTAKPSDIFYPDFNKKLHKKEIVSGDLTKEEFEAVRKVFPRDQQNQIHYAKPAFFQYNTEKDNNGIIACSPHFVGFFSREQNGKIKPRAMVHIFRIHAHCIKTTTKTLLFIRNDNTKEKNPIINCIIKNTTALMFSQILRRNYNLAAVNFTEKERCIFEVDVKVRKEIPRPFIYDLSPSQEYQFAYYAFSSKLYVPYNHEISEYYYDHIKFEDGVFDFGALPMDVGPKEFEPAVLALSFVQYLHAIICHKRNMPWLAESIACLVDKNMNLRFIHLVGCGITKGLDSIGTKMQSNKTLPLQYYNFSLNRDPGVEQIFIALNHTEFPPFYLNFSRCDAGSLRTLFDALENNENLWNIKYLYFNGNYSTLEDCQIFSRHLKNLYENGIQVITCLGIGGDNKGVSDILENLIKYPQPIVELSVAGTNIKLEAANSLIKYIRQATDLEILDLGYTRMDPNLIYKVILEMSFFDNVSGLTIKLDGNNLNRVNLMSIMRGFLYSDLSKWTSISLADNGMDTLDLDFLISVFHRMENIRELDLSGNFHGGMKDIQPVLAKIGPDFFPNLKVFRCAGPKQGGVGQLMYKMLDGFLGYNELEILDLSGNNLGEEGLKRLKEILENNPGIHTLHADNNAPVTHEAMQDLLEAIYSMDNITFFVFPIDDAIAATRQFHAEEFFNARRRMKTMRAQCLREIGRHRREMGLPSMVPFESVPELGQLVDSITESMHLLLNGINKDVHNGVCRDIGLTLPYLTEGEPIERGGEVFTVDIGEMVKYRAPSHHIRVKEVEAEEPSFDSKSDPDPEPEPESDPDKPKHPSSSSSSEEEDSSSMRHKGGRPPDDNPDEEESSLSTTTI